MIEGRELEVHGDGKLGAESEVHGDGGMGVRDPDMEIHFDDDFFETPVDRKMMTRRKKRKG